MELRGCARRRRSVPSMAAPSDLQQVALGVAVLGEDDHAAVGPGARRCLGPACRAPPSERRALVAADPVEQREHLGVGPRRGSARRARASRRGARGRGPPGREARRGRRRPRRPSVGLERLVVGAVLVVVVGSAARRASVELRPSPARSPTARRRGAPGSGGTPRRCESRRFWRLMKTSWPRAARGRISSVYSASSARELGAPRRGGRRARRLGGESSACQLGAACQPPPACAGRAARRCGSGSPAPSSRRSRLSRRTMTGSSCLAARPGTPRVKRCGSRISSSAEKLFEWPLCGVAERNRRFSKRGASVADHAGDAASRPRTRLAEAGRGGVRLVEDQQALARARSPRCCEQRLAVLGPAQRLVRDDEAVVRRPRVDAEAALLPAAGDEGAVVDLEAQAEAPLHLVAPLQADATPGRRRATKSTRWRRSSSCRTSPASMVLPRPTSSAMNRLARGSSSAFLSGVSWWSISLMPARNGAWNRRRVGGGDRVPAQRVQVRGEMRAADRAGATSPSPCASGCRTRAPSSSSQSTSSAPALVVVVEAHEIDARGLAPASAGAATSSTSYCRWRTWTMSPGTGRVRRRRRGDDGEAGGGRVSAACAASRRAMRAGRARPESSRPWARQAARSSSRPRERSSSGSTRAGEEARAST